MSMSKFGWSMPPGCRHIDLPGEQNANDDCCAWCDRELDEAWRDYAIDHDLDQDDHTAHERSPMHDGYCTWACARKGHGALVQSAHDRGVEAQQSMVDALRRYSALDRDVNVVQDEPAHGTEALARSGSDDGISDELANQIYDMLDWREEHHGHSAAMHEFASEAVHKVLASQHDALVLDLAIIKAAQDFDMAQTGLDRCRHGNFPEPMTALSEERLELSTRRLRVLVERRKRSR